MKFGIDVNGLDEATNAINELRKGINPHELARWTNAIENTAKLLCKGKENDISIKHTQGTEFNISYNDKESRDCIIRAIQTHLSSMPFLLRGVFEKLVSDLRAENLNQ